MRDSNGPLSGLRAQQCPRVAKVTVEGADNQLGAGSGVQVYNSVVGEAIPNYAAAALQLREYIVYEAGQVYPEYKVSSE